MKGERELAWLAGVVNVKGGFGVQRNGGHKYAKFQLASTNLELMTEVARLLSTEVTFNQLTSAGKEYWQLALTGRKAVALGMLLISRVTPERQAQITKMLEETEGATG